MSQNSINDIEVSELDASSYSQLHSFGNQSVFTHHKWIESFSDQNKKKVFLCLKHGNTVIAKIAGLKIQKRAPLGNELFFYSGPRIISQNGYDNRDLIGALLNYAKENKYHRLVVSSYDNWHNCIAQIPEAYLNNRQDYIFDITDQNPHQSHNNQFKKNYKKSLRVNPILIENSTEEGLSNLIKLLRITHSIRMKKKCDNYNFYYMPHTNEEQLRQIIKNQLAKIYEVRVDDTTHVIALNLEDNNSVLGLFMANDEFAYKNGLVAYFIHHMIDQYHAKGFTRYNFGGIPKGKKNEGLRTFKESIGAKPLKLNGITTNFLQYPHKLANPVLHLIRCIRKKLQ